MTTLYLGLDIRGLKSQAKQAETSLHGISKNVDSLSSSIETAAKRLIAFVGAYKAVQEMQNLVSIGLKFNNTIETAQIGMAALISTMGSIRNEQGKILENEEKYNAAKEISIGLIKEIQTMAMKTDATIEELLYGVQTIVSPALQAGIALEQIPRFAVAAAQAMKTLGIPLQQMRTELEAILTGNINSVQDVLVKRLDLSKEMIQQWTQQGVLFEKLMERLKAFEIASGDISQTWSVLISNVSEAFSMLAGSSVSGWGEKMKASLTEIRELIVEQGKDSAEISNNFINIALVLQDIGDKLGGAVLNATKSFSELVKKANSALRGFDIDTGMEKFTDIALAAAAAFGSLKISRAAYNSEVVKGIKYEAEQAGAIQGLINYLTKYDTSLQKIIATKKDEANAELKSAEAALTHAQKTKILLESYAKHNQAIIRANSGTKAAVNAEQELIATRAKLVAVSNQIAGAENKIAGAQASLSKLAKGATLADAAMVGLRNAMSGVMAFFGGPLGLAVTALTTGFTALATAESEAEKYAKTHAESLQLASEYMYEAADAAEEYRQKLKKLTAEELSYTLAKTQSELQAIINNRSVVNGYADLEHAVLQEYTGFFDYLTQSGTETVNKLKEILKPLENIKDATADDILAMRDKLRAFSQETGKMDAFKNANEKVIRSVAALMVQEKLITEEQKKRLDVTDELTQKTNVFTYENRNLENSNNDLATAQSQFNKETENAIQILTRRTASSAAVKALLEQETEAQANNAITVLEGARAYLDGQLAIAEYTNTLSGGAKETQQKVDELANKIKKLDAYINAFREGLQEEPTNNISQKTNSLKNDAEQAARAVASLDEQINRLTMTDKEFNEWEVNEFVKNEEEKFKKLGAYTDEIKTKIDTLAKAKKKAFADAEVEKAQNLEIQTIRDHIEFYKELEGIAGKYNAQLSLQNKLIDLQAKKYEDIKIPQDLIDLWKNFQKLQISEDPFDGAYRGLLQFTAEYENDAKQWESLANNFASNFESTTHEIFDDFLQTGKVSFSSLKDLFIQLLKDMAYQALIQPVVVSVVSSATQALGGFGQASSSVAGGYGSSAGGLAGLAQQYASSQLLAGAGSSTFLSGIAESINSFAASAFPSVFVDSSTATVNAALADLYAKAGMSAASNLSTTTFTSMLGSAALYGGLGSLGYSTLGSMIGLPQNQYTGITSGVGAALGGVGLGSALSGTALGATLGSAVPVIGTALGAVAGGLIGSAFGRRKRKKPAIFMTAMANLGDENAYSSPEFVGEGDWETTHGLGYVTYSNERNKAPEEISQAYNDAISAVSAAAWEQARAFEEALPDTYAEAFRAELAARPLKYEHGLKGGSINEEEIQGAVNEWSGMLQQTMVDAFGALDFSEYEGRINIDKSSYEGMNRFLTALELIQETIDATEGITDPLSDIEQQAKNASAQLDVWKKSMESAGVETEYATELMEDYRISMVNDVIKTIDESINPASEFSQQMESIAETFDDHISALKILGATEEQVKRLEEQRSEALHKSAIELSRATEQDLSLRVLALQYGSDTDIYALRQLQYQQENELKDISNTFGEDSGIYASVVEVQQAELLQLKMQQLQQELDNAQQELDNALAAQVAAQVQFTQQSTQNQISALDEQASALRDTAQEAENLRDAFESVTEALEDIRNDLWTSKDDNPLGTSYSEALQAFNDAYAKGRQGDTESLEALPSLATNLLSLGRDSLASANEYTDLFYDVDQKLKDAQEYAQSQVEKQDGVIDGINTQIDAINRQTETLQGAINAGTAASTYTGRSVDEIKADLEKIQALFAKELEDVTGDASLSNREELINAKVEQLNSIAYFGKTDWTARSFLEEMYKQGLTLESWYDNHGRFENLGITYDTTDARNAILVNKALQLNDQAYQGKTNWTAESTLEAIQNAGMTLDEWMLRFGIAEGITSIATPLLNSRENYVKDAAQSTNKVVDHGIKDIDKTILDQIDATNGLGAILIDLGNNTESGFSALSSSISGLKWNVVVNVNGNTSGNISAGTNVTNNNEFARLPSPTGIYGSYYATENALLRAKAESMRGNYDGLPDGYSYWSMAAIRAAIADSGLGSVQNWYEQFGRAEGFASGGITPINKPFWVGEQGPELMMSPRSWGVLDAQTSAGIAFGGAVSDDYNIQTLKELREIKNYLKQAVVNGSSVSWEANKIRSVLRKWDTEGLPASGTM